MGEAWMPGAVHLRACSDGGELRGGAPRAVWLTLETDPRLVSARSAAQRADQLGRAPHIVWNPLSGEVVQLIPILRAARALGGPDGLVAADVTPQDECTPVNREGRLCVQIGVVSFAREPFTAGPMTDLELIILWLDGWGMPRSWPAGPPAHFAHAYSTSCSRRLWACGGHFGISQVPTCCAAGPGEIDAGRLTGAATVPPIEVPRRGRDAALQRIWQTPAYTPEAIQFGRLHQQAAEEEAQLTSTG